MTGRPQGTYLASVALEVEFSGGYKFQLRGMRLVKAEDRTVLAMPNHTNGQGEWQDLVVPLNQETRDALEEAALAAWHKTGPAEAV